MANSRSKAQQLADGGSGPGYGLPDKVAPLPRQWQLPPPQAPAPRRRGDVQYFHSKPAGAGNSQQAKPSRWMERFVLLGLWLLVMLTAVAIGLRMLDPGAGTATPTEAQVRVHAFADAADVIRSAAPAAARSGETDAFDDIVSLPEPLPVPPSTPSTMLLTLSPTLALEHPAAPVRADVARRASREPVCADAIRAMQLCPD